MKGLLALLFVGALAFAIIGLWRGWFGVNVSDAKTDEVHVDLKMDKARLEDDARRVAESAKDLVDADDDSRPDAGGEEIDDSGSASAVLEGRVTSVGKETVVVLGESDIVEVVHLEPHTDLRLTGARTGLLEGDVVQVVWRREEGRKVAEKVTLK